MKRIKISKMVRVSDNWHPNFENNEVKLSLLLSPEMKTENYTFGGFVRIMAWGKDDFGLEMDFLECHGVNLEKKFQELKETIYDAIPEVVDKKYFYELGFYGA